MFQTSNINTKYNLRKSEHGFLVSKGVKESIQITEKGIFVYKNSNVCCYQFFKSMLVILILIVNILCVSILVYIGLFEKQIVPQIGLIF